MLLVTYHNLGTMEMLPFYFNQSIPTHLRDKKIDCNNREYQTKTACFNRSNLNMQANRVTDTWGRLNKWDTGGGEAKRECARIPEQNPLRTDGEPPLMVCKYGTALGSKVEKILLLQNEPYVPLYFILYGTAPYRAVPYLTDRNFTANHLSVSSVRTFTAELKSRIISQYLTSTCTG